MSIKDIIKDKKEWRALMARVKALPKDYQIVFKEIQKYIFKVGIVEFRDSIDLFSGIIDFFEEGAALGKDVLEITSVDVASFCDELVRNTLN